MSSQLSEQKRPSDVATFSAPSKRPAASFTTLSATEQFNNTANSQNKCSNKLPPCLKKLVRSIVRTFYSREHSLIVDMLVRNTIMKEDDLCERLRFEKKQLRQYLHTLKTDHFIKSKLQLETDAEGKTTKIIHYFIEYKLFVNVVKYRLDQMQRRLEAGQRQSSSRATFRCVSCNTTYTDLEVDRLLSLDKPGKLECVYCRAEVAEQEDHASRTDGRALIANFHRQVRDPIDSMLRECDEIHLSSAILEPEIRPLEPLKQDSDTTTSPASDNARSLKYPLTATTASDWDSNQQSTHTPTESRVRIVLTSQLNATTAQLTKQRPVWMADSTINSGPAAGLGELDRGPGLTHSSYTPPSSHGTDGSLTGSVLPPTQSDPITQTLAPGRIPTTMGTGGSASKEVFPEASNNSMAASNDIMQLLLVHERRGLSSHLTTKSNHPAGRNIPHKQSATHSANISSETNHDTSLKPDSQTQRFVVKVGDKLIPYREITTSIIKSMNQQEKAEYVRVGKLVYQSVMV